MTPHELDIISLQEELDGCLDELLRLDRYNHDAIKEQIRLINGTYARLNARLLTEEA